MLDCVIIDQMQLREFSGRNTREKYQNSRSARLLSQSIKIEVLHGTD
nr:MAG TPA: hypothetical protein [Caudoviricetes sp.]